MSYELKKNPVKEALRTGSTSFGMYTVIPSPAIVEMLGLTGFDWIRFDWSHAPLDLLMIENLIRAAECSGIAPFIRLELDAQKISSVLEMGAMGVIIPDIDTAEAARKAVDAVKFSPIGNRGMFSAPRKSGYGLIGGGAFKEWTNEEVMLAVQIESLEGIQNLEDILNVPGIDMVLSGRGDLSNALGVPGQKNHPSVLEAEDQIFQTALAKGIAISPQLDPTSRDFSDEVRKWIEKGAKVISFGHDLILVRKAFENAISAVK